MPVCSRITATGAPVSTLATLGYPNMGLVSTVLLVAPCSHWGTCQCCWIIPVGVRSSDAHWDNPSTVLGLPAGTNPNTSRQACIYC